MAIHYKVTFRGTTTVERFDPFNLAHFFNVSRFNFTKEQAEMVLDYWRKLYPNRCYQLVD